MCVFAHAYSSIHPCHMTTAAAAAAAADGVDGETHTHMRAHTQPRTKPYHNSRRSDRLAQLCGTVHRDGPVRFAHVCVCAERTGPMYERGVCVRAGWGWWGCGVERKAIRERNGRTTKEHQHQTPTSPTHTHTNTHASTHLHSLSLSPTRTHTHTHTYARAHTISNWLTTLNAGRRRVVAIDNVSVCATLCVCL